MENARALDEKLRRIIKEISDSTGGEIKHGLLQELVVLVEERQSAELRRFLESFNKALKRI